MEDERITIAQVFERVIGRLVECERRVLALEAHHVQVAGEIRKLAIIAKSTQDSLETSHAGNQAAFKSVADSLAALALRGLPPASASSAGLN